MSILKYHGNAKAWLEKINEMVERYDTTRDNDTIDAILQEITGSILSIQVRSGWHHASTARPKPVEYSLLLAAGGPGPALRLTGDLKHGKPETAWLEYNRELSWIRYNEFIVEDILTFARCFYFGE